MTSVTLKGNPVKIMGDLPQVGSLAPDFTVTKQDLSDVSLKDFAGKKIILSLFPSIDTPTCATAMRKFNEKANQLQNTVILCVSADLPFAFARFCGAEGLQNVIPGSVFRHADVGQQYGVTIAEGPVKGLLCRAVVVIDEQGKVKYTQLVKEISEEPDYQAVLENV